MSVDHCCRNWVQDQRLGDAVSPSSDSIVLLRPRKESHGWWGWQPLMLPMLCMLNYHRLPLTYINQPKALVAGEEWNYLGFTYIGRHNFVRWHLILFGPVVWNKLRRLFEHFWFCFTILRVHNLPSRLEGSSECMNINRISVFLPSLYLSLRLYFLCSYWREAARQSDTVFGITPTDWYSQ